MNELAFRPYGLLVHDLDIDFDLPSRPRLVTRILDCCLTGTGKAEVGEAFLDRLTVGRRIASLLQIISKGNAATLSAHLLCANDVCRREMEVDLVIEALLEVQHRSDEMEAITIQVDDETMRLRRPTGLDQMMWNRNSYPDERAAQDEMIRTLLLEPTAVHPQDPIPDEVIKTIDEAMQTYDPLVYLSIKVRCPYCEVQQKHEVDLIALALSNLRRTQQRMLEEVHRLALHYHWSEEQALSLPSWRRAKYLALLERETGR